MREILTGDTFATVLLVLFVDMTGDELDEEGKPLGLRALHWHPQTIKEYVEDHWGIRLPKGNFDKLMAAIAIVTTDLFFRDADRFIKLCNVLAGSEFDHQTFDPADALECAWGCTEALLLDPPDAENPEPFSDEVRWYVTHVLREEGFIQPPDILKIAIDGDFSAQVSYDFADDPEMFSGIYAVQQAKTEEVETILRDGLLELLGQLQILPLRHGSTADLEKRISQMIRGAAEKPLH